MADYKNSDNKQFEMSVLSGFKSYLPIEVDGLKFDVDNIFVLSEKDTQSVPGSISSLRASGKSLQVPVKGRFVLYKDGVVKEDATVVIGKYYPVIKSIGSRLISGRLYNDTFQTRRAPGIYPSKNKVGESFAEFNTAKGQSFNILLHTNENTHRKTIDFSIPGGSGKKVEKGGYALLKAFGISDSEIKKQFGDAIHNDNISGHDGLPLSEDDLAKISAKVYNLIKDKNDQPLTHRDGYDFIKRKILERYETLGDGTFSGSVNKSTLGHDHSMLTKELLLSASNEVAKINFGDSDGSARFSAEFKTIHPFSDQFRLALSNRKHASVISSSIKKLMKSMADGKVGLSIDPLVKIISGQSAKVIKSTFVMSQLNKPGETTNILSINNSADQVTIKGAGGIRSDHAITNDTVSLSPGDIGLFDLAKTQVASAGVASPLAHGAVIDGNTVKRMLYDRKEKRVRAVGIDETSGEWISFRRFFKKSGNIFTPLSQKVKAAKGGSIETVNESSVRYVLPDDTYAFSENVNLTPFMHHNSGPRLIMGANQMEQAVSLKDRQAPLVRSVDENNNEWGIKIGRKYNVSSTVDGVVSKVSNDNIRVRDLAGKFHDHGILRDFPMNQGAYIDHTPIVKEGDTVHKGQLLTSNNYTDNEGRVAIGSNFLTANMPWYGSNFEDGIVISESAAKKLTSVHITELSREIGDNDKVGFKYYQGSLGNKQMSPSNIAKIDKGTGMMKKGQTVVHGDVIIPIVSSASKMISSSAAAKVGRMFDNMKIRNIDSSIVWDHAGEGIITDIIVTPTKVTVYVKEEQPFLEGDKLSAFHGNKGIVSKIVPDIEMPHTKDGEPLEVLVDAHGIPSRMNIGQLMEAQAGNIARKTGKPYLVHNFNHGGKDQIMKELKSHGISDKVDLIDPQTGHIYPSVGVGVMHFGKLRHQIEKKFHARDPYKDGYDSEHQPVGGPSLDNLTLHALLGHGAKHNLEEMATLKGTRNDAFWDQMARGEDPIFTPEVPYSFKKTQAMLESLGVSVDHTPHDELTMRPATDQDVLNKSGGAITESSIYRSKGDGVLKVLNGSLFDEKIVGPKGKNWAHIELNDHMPNPFFKKPVDLLLKNSVKSMPVKGIIDGKDVSINDIDIAKVYTGEQSLNIGGDIYTGGSAIKKALSLIDLESTIKENTQSIKSLINKKGNSARVSALHRALLYAKSLNRHNIKPEDGYMMSVVPVLPAEFRQPSVSGTEIRMPSVNDLYRTVALESNAMKEMKSLGFSESNHEIVGQKKRLFDSVNALMGGDGHRPISDYSAVSISDQIAGPKTLAGVNTFGEEDTKKGPKAGYAQRRLTRRSQTLGARSTIVPDPELSIDEVGIPEEMAWNIFSPMVRKKLALTMGSQLEAKNAFESRNSTARVILNQVASEHPVLLNRAPSWWPYNIMAFKSKIVDADPANPLKKKELRIPNMVTKFFGADFDGDSVSIDTEIVVRLVDGSYFCGSISLLYTILTGYVIDSPYQSIDNGIVVELNGVSILDINGNWSNVEQLTIHYTTQDTYLIKTSNGREIYCTSDHSLMSQGQEISPSDLSVGVTVLDSIFGKVSLPENDEPKVVFSNDCGPDILESFYSGRCVGIFLSTLFNERNDIYYLSFYNGIDSLVESFELIGVPVALSSQGVARIDKSFFGINIEEKGIGGLMLPDFGAEFAKGFIEGVLLSSVYKKDGSYHSFLVTSKLFDDWASFFSIYMNALNIPHRIIRDENGCLIISLNPYSIQVIASIGIRLPDYVDQAAIEVSEDGIEEVVVSVEKVRKQQVVADFTVSGSSTFALSNGIVVHNTMAVHVPVGRAAIKEAWDMLPSRNAISPGNGTVFFVPEHSMLMGIALMTEWHLHDKVISTRDPWAAYMNGEIKISEVVNMNGHRTTAGWERLNNLCLLATSNKLSLYGILDKIGAKKENFILNKQNVKKVSNYLVKNHRDLYPFIMQSFSKAGNLISTREGFTVGLSDIKDYQGNVKKMIDNAEKVVPIYAEEMRKQRGLSKVSKKLRDEALVKLLTSASPLTVKGKKVKSVTTEIEDLIKRDAQDAKDNGLLKMMHYGTQGNPSQIRQILASPIMVQDVSKKSVPTPIKTGFGSGMHLDDYITHLHGTRQGLRDRSRETSRPGDAGKQIIATLSHLVISENDCHSREGVKVPLMLNGSVNKSALDRVIIGGKFDGKVSTPSIITELSKSGSEVMLRSPLHCHSREGICQKCYGYDEKGDFPAIGRNMGLLEGQSILEGSTKLTLKSFHTGGAVDKGVGGMDRYEELLSLRRPSYKAIIFTPKTVTGKSFIVTEISNRKSANGSVFKRIHIRGDGPEKQVVEIPPTFLLLSKIKVGATLKAGEKLTEGSVDPADILSLKGPAGLQKQLVKDFHGLLTDITGSPVRTSEMIVRGMSSYGRVIDNGTSHYSPNDHVRIGDLIHFNKNLVTSLPVNEALGHKLSKSVAGLPIGHIISEHDILTLQKSKINEVEIVHSPISYEKVVAGTAKVPRMGDDWLSKLNFRYLKSAIIDAGTSGSKSPIKGISPIGPYMYGKGFGKGREKHHY